jgi:Nucleotidyl transferase AbiEii toxin, Type IV TA system
MTLQNEFDAVAARFGADPQQVRRDHVISHVLAAIAAHVTTDDVAFFAGTALSRTYLGNARLSEDVDLIALRSCGDVAAAIEAALAQGLARSYGRPAWSPSLISTVGSEPAVLTTVDGTRLQIQLLTGDGYQWPTEVVDLHQRYSDAPPARMRTLTAPAFAASKLSAWIDRGAPRGWRPWQLPATESQVPFRVDQIPTRIALAEAADLGRPGLGSSAVHAG